GGDDSPERHAEDVFRSSHETADATLVEVLTGDARSAIHWLEELGVEFTRDPDGGYRLARCGGASAKRLLQVGDRTGHAITKALREAWEAGGGTSFEHSPLRDLRPAANGWRARCGEHIIDAGTIVLSAGGRCYRVAQAIADEVAKGKGVETPDGRPAVFLDTTRIPEADADISLPYMLRRYRAGGIDPLAEKILTYPVLHYQNGGLVIDTDAETTLE